ncbi:MAG TPA: hypothetical protein VEY09_17875 [Pyrinomonadaceae bacterium]|nr:hypothetical protein [Pyrinomonadaceae bacterium]
MNLELIDKLIAVVIVILGLTLFVQSFQTLVKKLLKLKSRQIEQSLSHLFHYVLEAAPAASSGPPAPAATTPGATPPATTPTPGRTGRLARFMPLLRAFTRGRGGAAVADPRVAALYATVTEEFRRVGRHTWRGNLMLDSVAKEDLIKFMGKVPAARMLESLFPESAAEMRRVAAHLDRLSETADLLRSEFGLLLTSGELAPVENLAADLRKVFGGGSLDAGVLVSDIIDLRQVDPDALLRSIAEAKARVSESVEARGGDQGAVSEVLLNALGVLDDLEEAVAAAAAHVATLRALVGRTEQWFDTVMQSFEERYARSMRTTTFVLSALVVVVLNANVVNIYREVSTNDARRELIIRAADRYKEAAAARPGEPASPESLERLYVEGRDVINKHIEDYTGLGFTGPAWMAELPDWLRGTGYYADPERNSRAFRLWEAARALAGWIVTALLLSAGAPFWQDTLESLFGIKNLLRKKTGTPNVAQPSGAGQPKP